MLKVMAIFTVIAISQMAKAQLEITLPQLPAQGTYEGTFRMFRHWAGEGMRRPRLVYRNGDRSPNFWECRTRLDYSISKDAIRISDVKATTCAFLNENKEIVWKPSKSSWHLFLMNPMYLTYRGDNGEWRVNDRV